MLNIEKRKIGFNIRLIREGKNMSREQLADRMKVSKTYIYQIESGKAGYKLDLIAKIARALEVPLQKIYQWEEPTNGLTKVKDSEVTWREKTQLTEAGPLKTLVKMMINIIEQQGIEVPNNIEQVTEENYLLELVTMLPIELQKKIQQTILDQAWKNINNK